MKKLSDVTKLQLEDAFNHVDSLIKKPNKKKSGKGVRKNNGRISR